MKNTKVTKKFLSRCIENETPVDIHFGKGVALRNVQVLEMDDICITSTSRTGEQLHIIESLGTVAPAVITHEGAY